MKKNLIVVLLFLLIDSLLIIYKFDFDFLNFRSQFWIIHWINCGIFFILNEKFLKIKLEFYDLLIIVMPGIGFLLLFLKDFFFFTGSFTSEIEESSELTEVIKRKREEEEIALTLEINTLSVYGILNSRKPKEKKELIMKFDFPDERFKIDFYKTALRDDDIEVIHYAAVEINKIDEKFQKSIKNLENNGEEEKLIETIIKYCESGLLNDSVLRSYQERVVKFLEKIENKKDESLLKLLKLYENMDEKEKCEKILEKKLLEEGCSKEFLKFASQFYYNQNNFKMFKLMEKRIDEEEREKG